MKSVSQPSNYFSPDTLKVSKQEPTAQPADQSPYLRAVLTDKGTFGTAKVLSMANSTMAAALRYIASSNKQSVQGKLITPAW